MHFKDLSKKKWTHIKELSFDQSIPETLSVTLVGWIGRKLKTKGTIEPSILEKLKWASLNQSIDQGAMGLYECLLCKDHYDRGEIYIEGETAKYVSPKMIIHYIEQHSYLPPKNFIEEIDKLKT